MAEDKTNRSRYQEINADIFRLLCSIPRERGWRHALAKKQCFRIMGISWLRDQLNAAKLAITRCEPHLPRMRKILETRNHWKRQGFDLHTEPFALRQLVNAISPSKRAALSFPKAVMGIVLCEAIIAALHEQDPTLPEGHAVYDHMYIEPAVSYITGLTEPMLKELLKKKGFIEKLREHTGQERIELFLDMARGHVVTDRTARLVHDVLVKYLGPAGINPPQTLYNPHRKYDPSENEDVDRDSDERLD